MPNGGRLSIKTAISKDMVQVFIQDTRQGIPSENLVKMFETFFTTSRGGTGLGLRHNPKNRANSWRYNHYDQ